MSRKDDPPVLIAYGSCWVGREFFGFDPDRVTSVLIDPETKRPPDVDASGQHVTPDPEATARSIRQPICPACCKKLNAVLVSRGEAPAFDETDTSDGQVQQ